MYGMYPLAVIANGGNLTATAAGRISQGDSSVGEMKLRVAPASQEQFIVTAAFNDPAIFDHHPA
jgi:hypothetical protein